MGFSDDEINQLKIGNFDATFATPPAFSASFFEIENIFSIQHTNSFNCDKIFIAYPKL
jgi:hypothetical protein